jgi:hypothetical protein
MQNRNSYAIRKRVNYLGKSMPFARKAEAVHPKIRFFSPKIRILVPRPEACGRPDGPTVKDLLASRGGP